MPANTEREQLMARIPNQARTRGLAVRAIDVGSLDAKVASQVRLEGRKTFGEPVISK